MRFVLVDRFLAVEPGRRATATKTFRPEDPVFADHFPGLPVVPGVLLTEAMGQAAGWAVAAALPRGQMPVLVMVAKAKFRRLVRPGEELTLEAEIDEPRRGAWPARTRAFCGGERVAEAGLVFHAVPSPDAAPEFEAWRRRVVDTTGLERLLARDAGPDTP